MSEAVFAWIFVLIGLITRNPDWVIASGLFAIAANVNGIYHKMDGKDDRKDGADNE